MCMILQNYTCTSGTYQKNMAVATLYDASCGESKSDSRDLQEECL